jgi:hypothetical protein
MHTVFKSRVIGYFSEITLKLGAPWKLWPSGPGSKRRPLPRNCVLNHGGEAMIRA